MVGGGNIIRGAVLKKKMGLTPAVADYMGMLGTIANALAFQDILERESQSQQINVGTQGTFGLLPYALQIYFQENKNLQIEGFWPVDEKNLPAQILYASQNNKTYFIFNEFQGEISNPRLSFIAKYRKGIGESYMRLYEVKSDL